MKLYQTIYLSIFLLALIMMMSILLSKKSIIDLNKSSPFECGFNNFSSPRMSFSIHFFMVAIIFLMFDIEIALLLPILISFKSMNMFQWMISSLVIVILITYGLYHEWINGVIEWSK